MAAALCWVALAIGGGPVAWAQAQGEAPVACPNGADDPDGRQRNRRVEVVLQRA
ncbi:MAG: hypothetical protein ICV73_16075 [Acetobacteraceae bacterium]|nr:hypothetical protein [Acetobacteraceae bacterium]